MKVVIHAPTRDSLVRARAEAAAFAQNDPDDMVRIVATEEAARMAAEEPDPRTDHLLILCAASLHERGIPTPGGVETTGLALHLIATLQKKGWGYIRA